MTPERHRRLMALFDEACELPAADGRRFVEALAQTDADLKKPLAEMLEVDRKSQLFFDDTQVGAALLAQDILQSALGGSGEQGPVDPGAMPASIGEYEVLERLGSGAMGTVYRARQSQPERVVALKTLHPWLVSEATLERFRFEAQALASLKHPGIPPVFTVGRHEGTVYLAMELVAGATLSQWARSEAHGLTDRARVLSRIAEAVHHAHLRGFVHRDLKPDNIRIAEDGTPKVLDFGIAAALGARPLDVSGTPAYMSPEQVDVGATVDVRTDVFSLGVIAFELFSGQLPAKPQGRGLATLQGLKKAPAPRLSSVLLRVDPDLDAIVAQALEVDPERRYASAADLAHDLEAWLAFEPVQARRGGRLYRAGRFVRRNRLLVGALSTTFLAVLVGGGVAVVQSVRAEHARVRAEAAKEQAASEAKRAQASLDFLSTVLAQADPEHAAGRQATVGAALDTAAAQLEKGAVDPLVKSAVYANLAETYIGLGEYKAAHEQAVKAVQVYDAAQLPLDELLPKVLIQDARTLREVGQFEETLALGERALVAEQRLHPEGVHAHVAFALHIQAITLREMGRLADALEYHRRAVEQERALAVGKTDTNPLTDALNQYAQTLVTLGRYTEAEPLYREALRLDIAQFGPKHTEVAVDLHHLAWWENEQDRPQEALALLDQALEIRLAALGPNHVRVGIQRNLEALAKLELGDVEGAERAFMECMRIAGASFGKDYARYTRMEETLILIRAAQGRVKEALEVGDRVVAAHAARYGPHNWVTEQTRSDYSVALMAGGRHEEAARLLEDALAVFVPALGEASRPTRLARARLAKARGALEAQGRAAAVAK